MGTVVGAGTAVGEDTAVEEGIADKGGIVEEGIAEVGIVDPMVGAEVDIAGPGRFGRSFAVAALAGGTDCIRRKSALTSRAQDYRHIDQGEGPRKIAGVGSHDFPDTKGEVRFVDSYSGHCQSIHRKTTDYPN